MKGAIPFPLIACPEAVCEGVGSDQSQIIVASGNHAIRGRSLRVGVTSDEAEKTPQLRVTYGEDSKSLSHQLRAESTHTASAQNSSTPVP
jgi:hypothetical protein